MFVFWLPVWSHSVDNTFIEKLDPENVGVAFGISVLLHLGTEIWVYFLSGSRHVWYLTSGFILQCWQQLHWKAEPQKCGCNIWNFVCISPNTWDISTSCLAAAMLDFWLPVWSHKIYNTPIGKLDPRNVDLAFGILFLPNLGAEIKLLPVWRPPCWISDFRFDRTALKTLPLKIWTLKI